MRIPGLLFLAGFTTRSQAYAQAMAARGLEPERAILYGDPQAARRAPPSLHQPPAPELFLPDLRIPLDETCRQSGWSTEFAPPSDVNSAAIARSIEAAAPRLIVYSGYPGRMVGPALLRLGPPLLHIHPGWLPGERGSTTLYYSLLRSGDCSASAILLDHTIDTGPVLARRRYPPPPPDVDADHIYDGAIRADLLTRVLAGYLKDGHLPEPLPTANPGMPFYVIHPVLKHLALLALERRP